MKELLRSVFGAVVLVGFLPIVLVIGLVDWLSYTDEELAASSWEDDD